MLLNILVFLDNLQISPKPVSLYCVFHSIRFKVNKVGVQRYSFFYAHIPHNVTGKKKFAKLNIPKNDEYMIKEDYLIRMIQEIISLITNAILNKKKFKKKEWIEYDCLASQILGFPTEQLISMNMKELIDKYEKDLNKVGKIELAAMSMLKLSEEMESDILQKSKLRQDGLALLKYVQKEGHTFSIQRVQLIELLEMNS